jgi:hypothetical protein
MPACLLAIALGLSCWSTLSTNNLSLYLWWGMLSSSKEQFLDSSNHFFRRGSYHLGNARRTWGETCGLKIGRCCVALAVQHTNPLVTPQEANE